MDILGHIGSLVSLNLYVFVIQILNLLILMVVLNFLLYKPLLRVFDRRKEIIDENMKKADGIRSKAAKKAEDAARVIVEAKENSRSVIAKTGKLLDSYREENLRNIIMENEQRLKERLTQIDSMKEEIRAGLEKRRAVHEKMLLEKFL